MDDFAQLTDAADQQEALARLSHEYEEWMRDEAAQTEYQSWIASLNSTR